MISEWGQGGGTETMGVNVSTVVEEGIWDDLKQKSSAGGGGGRLRLYFGIDGGGGQ